MWKQVALVTWVLVGGLTLAACQSRTAVNTPPQPTPTPVATESTLPADPELDEAMTKMDSSLQGTSVQDFEATGLSETELKQ